MKMENLYYPEMAVIRKITEQTAREKTFSMELSGGRSLGHAPGQFVELSIFGYGEAPISISSSPLQEGIFDLTIRNVGRLTDRVHRMKKGDKLGIRGPFGRGFDLNAFRGRDILFIAGGIGLAPLRSLIDSCIGQRQDYGRIIILYGSRSPEELMFRDQLSIWQNREDIEYEVTVDRADSSWTGKQGVITTLIPPLQLDTDRTVAAVVGPPVMYKFVMMSLKSKGLPPENIYMSLERRMKCGVGKCGHCQINHSYVCQDGPVYHYPEVLKMEEAL